MTKRASESELAGLHSTLAKTLKQLLTSGETSAGLLNVARQFLKDNGIDCSGEDNPEIRDIIDSIPTHVGISSFGEEE
jgi:hypothetical protein